MSYCKLLAVVSCVTFAACAGRFSPVAPPSGGLSVSVGADGFPGPSAVPAGDYAVIASTDVSGAERVFARLPAVSPELRTALLAQRRLLERQDLNREYVVGGRTVAGRHFLEVIDRLLDAPHPFVPEAIPVARRGEVHFTGYFSPDLPASRVRTPRFRYPLLRAPEVDSLRRRTRAQIGTGEAFDLGTHALAWVEHPLDVYLMQLQGSGYVTYRDGTRRYLGFGGSNGRPLTPIARALAESTHGVSHRGILAIRAWMSEDLPGRSAIIDACENYVYFEPADTPPTGAAGVPLTAMVSVAADPRHYPLGAVLLAEVPAPGNPRLRRTRILLVQDVGAAIKGRHRLDLYTGVGTGALDKARLTSAVGEVFVLAPQAS